MSKTVKFFCIRFVLCHKWSAAPASAYSTRRGPRGYFCSEYCTGGRLTA